MHHIFVQMAEKMDFAEVFAPQFVLPVVAVLVCAFVVFLFGFKHVAEPNFDFDSNDEKKKRQKQKKVKPTQTNGHIATLENPKTASQSASTTLVVSTEKQKELPSKTKDQKTKKGTSTSSTRGSVKTAEDQAAASAREFIENDGWTTCTSKKGKKKKSDNARFEEVVPVVTSVEIENVASVEVAPANEVPPQQQREVKKKSRTNKNEKTAQDKANKEETAQVAVQEPQVAVGQAAPKIEIKIPGVEIKEGQTTPPRKKKKKKNVNNKENSPTPTDVTPDASGSHPASTVVPAAHTSTSPNSGDTTADNHDKQRDGESDERLQNTIAEQRAQKTNKSRVPTDISIERQIADAMRESPQPSPTEAKPGPSESKPGSSETKSISSSETKLIPKEAKTNSAEPSKPSKSPKKNSKKKAKSNSNKDVPSQTNSSLTKADDSSTTVKSRPVVMEASPASVKDSLDVQEVTGASNMSSYSDEKSAGDVSKTNISSDVSVKPPTNSDSQPQQDAEWQEAKATKKRKKPRRD